MLNRQSGERTLPTLITLLVIGVLLMTFDVRSEGGGITRVLREGTQTIVAPLQKAAAFAVNPVIELIDSLSNVATLRETNLELQQELLEAQAALIAFNDDLARLALYEQLYDLESTGSEIGRTVAQIIGRPGPFDESLFIDKGTSDGIAVGQPVIDTNGYAVGTVQQATAGTATIVPITVGPDGVAVIVEDQLGIVMPQVNTNEMRLDILDAREPVFAGQRVVTSSASIRFPAGYPVGEIVVDAAPSNDGALSSIVRPYINADALRVVVVLAWPPDPITAIAGDDGPETTSTTSTTSGGDSTSTSSTSTTGGG